MPNLTPLFKILCTLIYANTVYIYKNCNSLVLQYHALIIRCAQHLIKIVGVTQERVSNLIVWFNYDER